MRLKHTDSVTSRAQMTKMQHILGDMSFLLSLLYGWKLKGSCPYEDIANSLRNVRRPHSRAVILKVWSTFGPNPCAIGTQTESEHSEMLTAILYTLLCHSRICYFSRNSFFIFIVSF